jgi:hypothetical protein
LFFSLSINVCYVGTFLYIRFCFSSHAFGSINVKACEAKQNPIYKNVPT